MPTRASSLVRPVPVIRRSRPTLPSSLDSRVSSSLATTKPSSTSTSATNRLGMNPATLVHSAVIAEIRLWVQGSSSISVGLISRSRGLGTAGYRRDMRRTVIQSDHQGLRPVPHQAEQITSTDLTVGGLENPVQASIIVVAGRRRLEQIA